MVPDRNRFAGWLLTLMWGMVVPTGTVLAQQDAAPRNAGTAAVAQTPAPAQSGAAAQSGAGEPAVKEVVIAAGAFTRDATMPAWSVPVAAIPKESPKGPLQVMLAESQIYAGELTSALIVRAFRINEQSALGDVGQYPVSFAPAYEKLRLHRLQIIRDGVVIDKTATVNARFLQRETGLESGVYSGGVTAMFLTDDLRVGDVFFIAYSKEGSNPVFGKTFFDAAAWDASVAAALRRVILLSPPGRDINWTMQGDGDVRKIAPEKFDHKGLKGLLFEQKDLQPIQYEPATPSSYVHGRYIQFSEYRNWNEVARWGVTMFAEKPALPPELQAALAQWKTLPDDEARARAALRWVQDEIRYFSVSIGESSHRPSAPEEVVRRRYGDCKDKTYMLVSLLAEMGIEAYPILVNASSPKSPGRSMPSPSAFDHVLAQARIGGKLYYLDGTRSGQRGPLDRMGMTLVGATGLLLKADTQELITMVSPVQKARMADLSEKFRIDSFGKDGKLSVQFTYRDLMAESYRVALPGLTAAHRRQVLLSDYERRYPGIALVGEPRFSDDEALNQVTVSADFNVPNLATEQRGDWSMRFFPAVMVGIVKLPPQINRLTPAVIGQSGHEVRYDGEVIWPEAVGAMLDPFNRRLNNDYFSLDVQRSFRGNVSTVAVNYVQRAEVIAPKDLPRLLEEVRSLERTIGGVMFVGKEQIKATGFLGMGKASFQDNMKQSLAKTIASASNVIRDKTLSGDDLAEVHCERASALSDSGRFDEALADAEQAVKIAPSLGNAWQCLQLVHFASGRFEQAVQVATKALSLGADAAEVLNRRGYARFFLGQFDAAAGDFARAADLKDRKESEGGLYSRLWQSMSLARAGKAQPEVVTQLVRSEPDGAWPRIALALMAGARTPEQVMAQVNRKSGDDLLLTSTEAWFFVAQAQLIKGDFAQARESLKKVRDNGIVMYIEHVGAGFELARMDGAKGASK